MSDHTVYIILFKDFTLTTALIKPEPNKYQSSARFFAVDEKFTLGDLSECFFFNWDISQMPERLASALKPVTI